MVATIDERQEDIDLRAVAGTLWAKRSWLVASAVFFTVPFVVAAILQQPVYLASTVLVDARADTGGALNAALSQLGNLASIARVTVPTGATHVDEALAVLRSREFTEGFIRDASLMPELFPARWDTSKNQWRGPEEDWPTLAQGYRRFDDIRTVAQAGRGGLVTVTIEWVDPDKAAQWVNDLVARLNAEMRARAIGNTNLSVSYLERELAATTTLETRQAINRLMEAQINQRMVANVTEEFAFRVVDRALPPDPDDTASPSGLLLVALGPIIGLIFGAFAVLAANVISARRAADID